MKHEFLVLLETYPLMQNNDNISTTINSFRDCLRGAPKALFHDLITVPVTYRSFQDDVWTLSERILGPGAVRDQLAYRTIKLWNSGFRGLKQ